jgi:hypothetical protein
MAILPDPRRERILAAVAALLDAVLPAPVDTAPEPAPPAPSPQPLVDKRELARVLGVSVATIDRLDREGQPHVRVGDVKRYCVADVVAWHRERTPPPSEAPAAPRASASAPQLTAGDGGVKLLSRPPRREGGR